MNGRGPVIFTTLYLLALVLTWATLLSIERFGTTEFKAWAPFLQAVLSAAAIFSAWWLQERKRDSDRREAERDTLHSALTAVAQIEWATSGLLKLRKRNIVHIANAMATAAALNSAEEIIKRLNSGHFDEQTRSTIYNIIQNTVQFQVFINSHVERNKDKKILELGPIYYRIYLAIYNRRSTLLEMHNLSYEAKARTHPGDVKMDGDSDSHEADV